MKARLLRRTGAIFLAVVLLAAQQVFGLPSLTDLAIVALVIYATAMQKPLRGRNALLAGAFFSLLCGVAAALPSSTNLAQQYLALAAVSMIALAIVMDAFTTRRRVKSSNS
ncbi:MAG: hypothetical protein M3Z14_04710 [Candidatus Eremiobacteraeota bacterium]|nr:hypothetical protein [Candidatus Eremiobacteraeota bacterium]